MAARSIKISALEETDRNVVMQFCEATHMDSIFAHIPFSPKKFQEIFDNIVSDGTQHFGMKAVRGDRVVGVVYYTVGGYFIGDGARVVSVVMIKVASQVQNTMLGGKVALHLVRSVKAWAKANNADVVLFHVTSGQNLSKTDRFFRKLGMKTIGGNYGAKIQTSH
ncbi:MAG: hypothetical protein AAGA97_01070 [Pseudomonadota bacterium]